MLDDAKIAAMLLRKYGSIISDEECKELIDSTDNKKLAQYILQLGSPFNGREAQVLSIIVGEMDDGTSFSKDGDLWRDDILEKYADFVHNYEYVYNDEALKVDPTIDTEQVHIGPMAQDLEMVNPAVVVEDSKTGYKTVDTSRLSMMNAGAIADLAREVQELKDAR